MSQRQHLLKTTVNGIKHCTKRTVKYIKMILFNVHLTTFGHGNNLCLNYTTWNILIVLKIQCEYTKQNYVRVYVSIYMCSVPVQIIYKI